MADELDQLYSATPEKFTALRTELAAAARKRGDTEAAKQISGARKPTTAAWVVNRLVDVPDAVARLRDLGVRMRAAHAAGNGESIRELTAEQRALVGELTRTALASADQPNPTSALRDDVHGTLQAAVADPDVTARIGRLTKAERWSGFGDFGDITVVSTVTKVKDERRPTVRATPRLREEQAQKQAKSDVVDAEQRKRRAQEVLDEQRSRLEAAHAQRDEAHRALQKAERDLAAAQAEHERAQRSVDTAAKVVREARAAWKRRGS